MKQYMLILILLISLLNLNGCYSLQSNQQNLSFNSLNELPVTDSLHLKGLNMIDKLNGWVISDKSVLKTEDGGDTWLNVLPLKISEFPNGVKSVFLDQNVGWVLIDEYNSNGKPVVLYSTIDGGKQWKKSELTIHGIISLAFASSKNGWLLSSPNGPAGPMDNVLVYHTTDGGDNWVNCNPSGLPSSAKIDGIFFTNNDKGFITGMNYATGNSTYFFKSTTSGFLWENQKLNVPDNFKDYIKSTEPPLFWNEENGIIPVVFTRGDDNQISFSRTKDGGMTWTSGKVFSLGPMTGNNIVPYDFIDEKYGWLVYNGELYKSSDGSSSWEKVSKLSNIVEISFLTSKIGWAVAFDGKGEQLYRTDNGGASWVNLYPVIN
ncbi:YCF48-related protein [Desulfosporosinus sp. PR]|uniref:WD40/YVTN/BNR-like repeat-containing protein n=1 Tax=Candidatus Desulfosporosinus nitrosoreducens TaxID=3401928 RepID=UPI0027FEFE88|nr:YCF48-related protein [Desulfosporosinus sp. PR]MDQ7092080.1 YCF48-related protein [Desulfosporosinus sp. PR]